MPNAGISEHRRFFLFCAGTVFYVALLGNMLEHGENMRFRVQTDPLLYLAALQVAALIRRPSRGRNSRAG